MNRLRTLCLQSFLTTLLLYANPEMAWAAASAPNILFIMADDLGFGDPACYGGTGVKTPSMDRLAKEGLRFTDAHATSATCTPSRYAFLTGEYPWRKAGTGVLPGDAALVIEPTQTTLATVLKQVGYRTGVVGKWHLGLGAKGGPDWNGHIRPGPSELGFDYSFLMPATGDRVPCVFVENQRVVGLDPNDPIRVSFGAPVGNEPTGKKNPELLKLHPSHGHDQTIINGVSRIGYMTGGKAALWKDEDMADTFTARALRFIEESRGQRFFLYFASHDPHVPRLPHPRFVGTSSSGIRGDAIAEFDWCVGQLLNALDRLGLASNTLVVLTSDNGPVVDDGYRDGSVENLNGHKPAGYLRGGKYSNFEAGTRVPMLVRWPGRIKPGVSKALFSQVDFIASFAKLAGTQIKAGQAPDSLNALPALLGRDRKGRSSAVEHASTLSLRLGTWKYITSSNGPKQNTYTQTDYGNDAAGQIYDLSTDPSEGTNLVTRASDKRTLCKESLNKIVQQGRMPGNPAPRSEALK